MSNSQINNILLQCEIMNYKKTKTLLIDYKRKVLYSYESFFLISAVGFSLMKRISCLLLTERCTVQWTEPKVFTCVKKLLFGQHLFWYNLKARTSMQGLWGFISKLSDSLFSLFLVQGKNCTSKITNSTQIHRHSVLDIFHWITSTET